MEQHHDFFSKAPLVTTGSTGKMLHEKLGIPVEKIVASGPLGGDQAIGGLISENKIASIFFFQDPLTAHPHYSDIAALTRLCDVYQIPFATNPSSALGVLLAIQRYGFDFSNVLQNKVIENYKNKQQIVLQKLKGKTNLV